MERFRTWRPIVFSDLGILILLALARIVLHTLTNGQYGFHRDELAMLDNARHLDWGYVDYPPLTPLIGRVALELFGPSLVGLRLFSALAQSTAMVLAGLMARELGGTRLAQVVAALAVAIAPVSLAQGALFQYVTFDYLWWVLIAYLTIRMLKSDDPRWWPGIGVAIGLGMLTKYTVAFYVAGVAAGVVLTQARRYLTSPWLWGGVALSLLIFLPNLIWQVQHNFISLDFLGDIHARDIRIGRTGGYLTEQFYVCANLFTIPLWVAGLYFYFFAPVGRRYRPLGWMFAVPFVLFLIAQSRAYYLAPAYPMLIAAGAMLMERWLASLPAGRARMVRRMAWGALVVGGVVFGAVALPIAPVNSPWYDVASTVNDGLKEEIGWPELAETVAGIYTALPAEDKAQAGILAGNYGEAGALNLYGPAYGLPEAISGINSYWLRGYGDPPPQTLIVLGLPHSAAEQFFETCDLAGHVTNRYGIENEETRDHPDIFVCRRLRQPWPELWKHFRWFG
jgi:4-amino-4-deoxy-L-arabinose transferase-like glycosyltransferase